MHSGEDACKSKAMREMFGAISRRYDLLNRLMTFGRDRSWRRTVAREAALHGGEKHLDVGAGTGGIAREALRLNPDLDVVAADVTLNMMAEGRQRPGAEKIRWCQADALNLPFQDAAFHAVTSGYLIRNVPDAKRAFEEQVRVVKPGGRVVCLDTSPPPRTLLRPLIILYFKWVIPLLGQWIGGSRAAYRYLPESTRRFMGPERLAEIMEKAGLRDVGLRRFMFGTQVVLTGRRP